LAVLHRLLAAKDGAAREFLLRHHDGVATGAGSLAGRVCPELSFVAVVAGALHDVGKIGIGDAVLFKPGPLSREEWIIMKQHPVAGSELVERINGELGLEKIELELVVAAIRHHHERWDGKGYPGALKGKEIPYLARVLAVADAYNAMRTDRPYRRAMEAQEALREIVEGSGSQFDPELAEAFLQIFRKKEKERWKCLL
jgi:HD-GYP domain-containing protein (c-di-GMP phosphodiesterase class II)